MKRAAQRLLRFVKPGGRAVDQIEIGQPVGVVINPSATRPHRLNQVLLRSRRVVMNKVNPCSFRDVSENNSALRGVTLSERRRGSKKGKEGKKGKEAGLFHEAQ